MKKQTARYKRFTRSRFGNAVYSLILVLAGLFTVIPLVYSVVTSFKPLDELLAFPPKFFVVRPTFKNYIALPELVLVSSMAAFVTCQVKNRWTKLFFLLVQFALLYNGTTLAVPQYLIFAKIGIIDTYWAYILPALASTMGVFLVKQFMESNVPEVLIEAARIDGAGAGRIFWRLVMPLSKPAWLTLTLFSFQTAWAATGGNLIFSESLKTLPSVMGSVVSSGLARSGSAMAVTVLMMIPPVLIYMATQSNVLETMSSAGIKD